MKRLSTLFYWKGLRSDVQKFIHACDVCQKNKADLVASPGLLQPLVIPDVVWSQISMDFITGLPSLPDAITSDRDAIFLSTFWQELFTLQGFHLHTSSAYHPQSDSQTKVLNRCLETYLRCFYSEDAFNWSNCLPMAEYWYNTSYHSAIHMTPYEALYGRPSPLHLPYLPGESASAEVDNSLLHRELILQLLKHNLTRAQLRMKQ